jgi:hypothetical protein
MKDTSQFRESSMIAQTTTTAGSVARIATDKAKRRHLNTSAAV